MKLPESAIKDIEESLSKGLSCEVSCVGDIVLVSSGNEERVDLDLGHPLLIPIDSTTGQGVVRIQAAKDGGFISLFDASFGDQEIYLMGVKLRRPLKHAGEEHDQAKPS